VVALRRQPVHVYNNPVLDVLKKMLDAQQRLVLRHAGRVWRRLDDHVGGRDGAGGQGGLEDDDVSRLELCVLERALLGQQLEADRAVELHL